MPYNYIKVKGGYKIKRKSDGHIFPKVYSSLAKAKKQANMREWFAKRGKKAKSPIIGV